MIENNIITNFYDKRAGVKDHSFYELSAFGQEIRMGRMGKMDNIGKMDKKSLKIIEKPNTLDTHETPEISERPVKPEEPDENNETIREEKTTTKYEKPLSANFRTIRHPEFKKYENLSVKLSKNSIAPIKKERIEYTDPFLNLRVIKRTGNLKVREKHNLPTPRQFYILHKQPFKTKNKVEPKY
jgi:hypothetical protein